VDAAALGRTYRGSISLNADEHHRPSGLAEFSGGR
jgi:hypothetical protein